MRTIGKFRVSRPTPSMCVALLALFVALGGSSYAAIKLQKNSVQSKHIQNGQVKKADMAKDAVTSSKVKDATLLATDFKSGQLPSGPAGPQGSTGNAGAPGRDATNLFAYVRDPNSTDPAVLMYGKGATSVADAAGHSEYTVTFNRSLVGCVGHADAGYGDPRGTSYGWTVGPGVVLINGNQVTVRRFAGHPVALVDTSFMLSVFC